MNVRKEPGVLRWEIRDFAGKRNIVQHRGRHMQQPFVCASCRITSCSHVFWLLLHLQRQRFQSLLEFGLGPEIMEVIGAELHRLEAKQEEQKRKEQLA